MKFLEERFSKKQQAATAAAAPPPPPPSDAPQNDKIVSVKFPAAKIEPVVPPAKFAGRFSNMSRGCYCWRIINLLLPEAKKEVVLVITAEFLFICNLEGSILRVVRCQDVECVALQDGSTTTPAQIAIKAYAKCFEPSILISLVHDRRNPVAELLHPVKALNFVRKPRTGADLMVVKIPTTLPIHSVPLFAGTFEPGPRYLAPNIKFQIFQQTGAWPSQGAEVVPEGEEAVWEGADGSTNVIRMGNKLLGGGRLQWFSNDTAKMSDIRECRYADGELVLRNGNVIVTPSLPVSEEKKMDTLKVISMVASKARIRCNGLPSVKKSRNRKQAAEAPLTPRGKEDDPPPSTPTRPASTTGSYRHDPYKGVGDSDSDVEVMPFSFSPSSSHSSHPLLHLTSTTPRHPQSPLHGTSVGSPVPSLLEEDSPIHASRRSGSLSAWGHSPFSPTMRSASRLSNDSGDSSVPPLLKSGSDDLGRYTFATRSASQCSNGSEWPQSTMYSHMSSTSTFPTCNPPEYHQHPFPAPPPRLTVALKYGRMLTLPAEVSADVGTYVHLESPEGPLVGMVIAGSAKYDDTIRVTSLASPGEVEMWAGAVEAEGGALRLLQGEVQDGEVDVHRCEYLLNSTVLVHYSSSNPAPNLASFIARASAVLGCRVVVNNCRPFPGQPGDFLNDGALAVPMPPR